MRNVLVTCPRLVDGNPCDAEREIEVDVFYEGGWCAQFELPDACDDGHVWTDEEKQKIQQDVIERAVEPRDPIEG